MKIWEYLLPVVYSTRYCEGTPITNKKLFLTLNIIFIALLRLKEIREISRGNPQPQTYIGTVQILSWTQSFEQQTLQLKKKKKKSHIVCISMRALSAVPLLSKDPMKGVSMVSSLTAFWLKQKTNNP